mgnify:CR=1 FL=1
MNFGQASAPAVLISIAAYGYLLFIMFTVTSPRRAAGTGIIGGILLLPIFKAKIPHIPVIDKGILIGILVLGFSLIFDRSTWKNFKLRWFDLPVLLWCSSSILSSLTNSLGFIDGLYETGSKCMLWGVPYFIGRVYYSDPRQSRNLAMGIFVGGLIYVPLCLIEINLSPQLHRWVYGYHPHSFEQSIRFGGYRPVAFMSHGLMLGLWMTLSTLCGVWLWKLDLFRKNEDKLAKFSLVILVITTFLVKSSGALIFLLMGLVTLYFDKQKFLKFLVISLALIPFIYVPARTMDYWTGKTAVDLAANYIGPDRAYSLAFRLDNEEIMIRKTMEKPLFGWGGWGRGRVYDEDGKDVSVTDSLWIIAFTQNGFWGTFWLYFCLILPCLLFFHYKIHDAGLVYSAPMSVLTVCILLYVLDTVLNNMPNPVYMILIGAVNGQSAVIAGLRDRQKIGTSVESDTLVTAT